MQCVCSRVWARARSQAPTVFSLWTSLRSLTRVASHPPLHKPPQKMAPAKFSRDFGAAALNIRPMVANKGGKGKSAMIDVRGGANMWEGEEFKVLFKVKPGMGETKLSSFTKMKLVLEIDPENEVHDTFMKKLKELDDAVLKNMFDSRDKIWPDKARHMNSIDAVRPLQNLVYKEAQTKDNGVTYRPQFTLQCMDLASLVDRLELEMKENKDGSKEEVVKDVVWRTITDDVKSGLGDRAPKLYLCTGKTAEGKDRLTQRVPVLRPDGAPLTDAGGKEVFRWVGPQDIVPGSVVRPLFSINKVYCVSAFGVHLKLEALIIKPPPPKASTDFADAVVEEGVDPLLTSKILREVKAAAEPEGESAASDDEREAPAPPAAPAPELPAVGPSPAGGRKRKAEDAAPKEPKAKTRRPAVEDE